MLSFILKIPRELNLQKIKEARKTNVKKIKKKSMKYKLMAQIQKRKKVIKT